MKTITTIKFAIVEDIENDTLVLCDNRGRLPEDLSPSLLPLTEAQLALWEDYTHETEGKPFYFSNRIESREETTEQIIKVAAARSRNETKGKRKDVVTLKGAVYTVTSTLIVADPAPGMKQALRDCSTTRYRGGDWDCWLTGKDADLEAHGEQAICVLGSLGGYILCEAFIGKSFSGSDVYLNLPADKVDDEEFIEKAKDAYLEQAQEIVSGCGVAGDWDGDGWYLSETVAFRVRRREALKETTDAIIAKAQTVLASFERELRLADEILNQLSGWTDGKGNAFPEGKPGEGSIGFYLANQASILSEEDLDWQARNEEGK